MTGKSSYLFFNVNFSSVVPMHGGSFQVRDQTHVPYTGRQVFIHGTTREIPKMRDSSTVNVGSL